MNIFLPTLFLLLSLTTTISSSSSFSASSSFSFSTSSSSTQSEKQEFLDAHNKARLHAGEAPYHWDQNLANYATQYAHQRLQDCALVHSKGPYGENIFWGSSGNQWTPTDVVRLWIKEHKFYNRNTRHCLPGRMCGHYTQIVWRRSSRLGCARVRCDDGGVFAICNYDPPGNYVGQGPFDF